MYDFLEQSTRLMHQAAKLGGIDPDVSALMAAPARVVAFRIPMKMDDGSFRIFDAYRVRYNDALGPSRDGTRISADLDLDECKALALIMSIKHAAGLIPAGGGKGGITADPAKLSRWEFERLCRAYIRYLRPAGPDYDVPGADVGTDLQSMAWMLDEYEQITGRHCPAAINDKPPIVGGTLGGYEATGRGVFDVFKEAATDTGLEIESATVAVQGFGQVGSVAATMFFEAGCRVIAVSDIRGGIYNKEGIDIPALLEHSQQTGSVVDFPGTRAITNAELLESDCDVLVPAALQGVITAENAGRIRARMLVEAANAPTTVEADAILTDKGITVVPDVLVNSGSVHLCQMERTQGLSDDHWDMEKIDHLRHKRQIDAYRAALRTAARHNVASARLGAWINALKRIEEAVKTRGWC
jgi:glutamate dehydrogenase